MGRGGAGRRYVIRGQRDPCGDRKLLHLDCGGEYTVPECDKETFGGVDMFTSLIVVMVSAVQTYQHVYIKYVQLFNINYSSIKL